MRAGLSFQNYPSGRCLDSRSCRHAVWCGFGMSGADDQDTNGCTGEPQNRRPCVLRWLRQRGYSPFAYLSSKQRACWRGSSQEPWDSLWCCPSSSSHWDTSTWVGDMASFSSSSTVSFFLSHFSQNLGRSTSDSQGRLLSRLKCYHNTKVQWARRCFSRLQNILTALFIWTVTKIMTITNKELCCQRELKPVETACLIMKHICADCVVS